MAPRRYRRYRAYRSARSRYSNETAYVRYTKQTGSAASAGDNFPAAEDPLKVGAVIVPPSEVFGVRKVKNFTISLTTTGLTSPVVAVLIYVPQGTPASLINLAGLDNDNKAASLYNPNQNVIGQFVIPANADSSFASTRYSTRLSRNLSSGDTVRLLFASVGPYSSEETFAIAATVNFAIKY